MEALKSSAKAVGAEVEFFQFEDGQTITIKLPGQSIRISRLWDEDQTATEAAMLYIERHIQATLGL